MRSPIEGSRLLGLLALVESLSPALALEVNNFSVSHGAAHYTLTAPANVTVTLFDRRGNCLRTCFAGPQPAGPHEVAFQLRNAKGTALPPGSYRIRVAAGRSLVRDNRFAKTGFAQFTNPVDVKIDPGTGEIYVLDRGIDEFIDGKATGRQTVQAAIYRLKPDGTPGRPFAMSGEGSFPVPMPGDWLAVDRDRIYYDSNNAWTVNIHDKQGFYQGQLGGYRPAPRTPGDLSNEGIRGIYYGRTGGALGPGNSIYIRNGAGSQVKKFDRTKPKGEGWIFSSRSDIELAPMLYDYVGPSFAINGRGAIYLTAWQRRILRFDETHNDLALRYGFPAKTDPAIRDLIGISVDTAADMLYVADRGTSLDTALPVTAARVHQLWDDGQALTPVVAFTLDQLRGLRTVQISPDGAELYVLEDGHNYRHAAYGVPTNADFPSRDVQGQGRLFRFRFSYACVLEKPFEQGVSP